MSFPSNPVLGDTHQVDTRRWTFNGEGWEQVSRLLPSPPPPPSPPAP